MKKILIPVCTKLFLYVYTSCNQSAEYKTDNKSDSASAFHIVGASQITIATNDIEKSKAFYELLGFKLVQEISIGNYFSLLVFHPKLSALTMPATLAGQTTFLIN